MSLVQLAKEYKRLQYQCRLYQGTLMEGFYEDRFDDLLNQMKKPFVEELLLMKKMMLSMLLILFSNAAMLARIR